MSEEPIRLALIGAGNFARDVHVPTLQELPDRFQVVAVYSRTEAAAADRANQLGGAPAVYTDLDALLARDDVEAVDVVLPISVMPEAVARSLRAGKHILSEKPIAGDRSQATALLDLWREHRRQVWMVGENWRYEDAFVQAARLVREGAIGRPLACRWTLHNPIRPGNKYFATPWRRDNSFPGGFILDGGVHHVAALRLILGEIQAVCATTAQVSPDLPPADTISATLRFAGGVQGIYQACYAAANGWPPFLDITGADGALRVDRGYIELVQGDERRQMPCRKFNAAHDQFLAFADAIRRGAPHINTPQAALADLAVVEAMLRAADTGAWVEVDNGGWDADGR